MYLLQIVTALSFLLFSVSSFSQTAKFVKGTIVDSKTERPLKNVKMQIISEDSTKFYDARTNENGVYKFENIPLGEHLLVINDKTYNRKRIEIILRKKDVKGYTHSTLEAGRKVTWLLDWGDSGEKEHYWFHFVSRIIIVIYFACLTLILFYSILQLSLAIAYVRNKYRLKRGEIEVSKPVFDPNNTPKVTVQLPMFNELYVAERIIETVAAFDYLSG